MAIAILVLVASFLWFVFLYYLARRQHQPPNHITNLVRPEPYVWPERMAGAERQIGVLAGLANSDADVQSVQFNGREQTVAIDKAPAQLTRSEVAELRTVFRWPMCPYCQQVHESDEEDERCRQ